MSSDIKEDRPNASKEEEDNAVTKEFCANRTLSWHEHVYKKLTNKPTPHLIENILGIQNRPHQFKEVQDLPKSNRMTVSAPVSPQDKFPKLEPSVNEVNEPLNLSIRSDLKVRTKTVKGTTYSHLILTPLPCNYAASPTTTPLKYTITQSFKSTRLQYTILLQN